MTLKDHINRKRREYEVAVASFMVAAATLMVIGALLMPLQWWGWTFGAGLWSASIGLACYLLSLVLTYPIDSLRTIFRRTTGGSRYDKLRYASRIRIASVSLQITSLVAGLVFFLEVLGRGGFIRDDVLTGTGLLVVASVLLMVLIGLGSLVHVLSLRAHLPRPSLDALHVAMFLMGLGGTALFAMVSILLAVIASTAASSEGLVVTTDGPIFLLGGIVLGSLTLIQSRGLPTFASLFTDAKDHYGSTYGARRRSVVTTVLVAFGLLFLVVLLILVFGVSVLGVVDTIPRNTLLIGVFAAVVTALVAGVAVTAFLSRSHDEATELFKAKRSAEARTELVVLSVSAGLFLFFLAIAFLLLARGHLLNLTGERWLDALSYAFLGGLGPYGFYKAHQAKRTRELEERFPDFLRDLAASHRAGLTLDAAVRIAARGEYGALTPEINKMADQLSWNVPFDEALRLFGDRVNTPLVQRAVGLIIEASRSGGGVTDVLGAAARDARELKNLERERAGTMSLYTIVIYVAFLVFLAVVAVLQGTLVPEILKTAEATGGAGGGGFGGVSFGDLTAGDYRQFYFLAGLMQALGNGMVAGLMGSGRIMDGLRHSWLMVLITYVTFTLLLPT